MRRLKNYLKIRPAAWLTLCLLFTALAAWAFVIEPRSLVVREHQLSLPSWPSTLHGLRVAVLADLHTGSPFNGLDKLERIVQETNQAQPDLILIPGDIVVTGVVGGRFVPPESIASTLRKLRAPVGVYAVLGNHDRGLDTERIRRALNQAGIPTLEDHAMLVSFRQKRLWLAGVSDFWTAGHKVKHTLTQVTTSDPVILFTHNPDIFPEIPNRVMLTIAGHTHGGQVALPL
ncbi:MAG: metallophosphoesterase, partial [Nitrospira sp.]|nr:metallophosphoesterase [Nitrospira sp.]